MNPRYQRATLLFGDARYEAARQELGAELAADPSNVNAHALLAVCLAELNEGRAAMREAQAAIRLNPEEPFAHYALAKVLQRAGQYPGAERAVKEALRLRPEDAKCLVLLAVLQLDQLRWKEGLGTAEHGLRIHPGNIPCANLRALALRHLGRSDEAERMTRGTLACDPENASSHASRGWVLLQQGDPTGALRHFREALRLNPNMKWAREGIIRALKARNPVYRLFLRYFLWVSRFPQRQRSLMLVALYIASLYAEAGARAYPHLAPVLAPIFGLYVLLALTSWLADPVFDLLLAFDPVGRQVLRQGQIAEAHYITGCLASAFAAFVAAAVGMDLTLAILGLFCLTLLLPASCTFHGCDFSRAGAVSTIIVAGSGLVIACLAASMGAPWASVLITAAFSLAFMACWLRTLRRLWR
jgi:tetratricopeptide (TPR) repeat protein